MQAKFHQDIVVGIILMLGSTFLFIKTFDLMSGAAIFPRVLLMIFFLFSILIILGGVKKTKLLKQGAEIVYDGDENLLTIGNIKAPVLTLLIVIIYISLMTLIGFFPSTILFMFGFLAYMKVKEWKTYAYTIVGLNLFIYLVFVMQLNVQLPLGILFK